MVDVGIIAAEPEELTSKEQGMQKMLILQSAAFVPFTPIGLKGANPGIITWLTCPSSPLLSRCGWPRDYLGSGRVVL